MQRARPLMPEGYGISRDEAGMLDWPDVLQRVRAARNYWVVTANAEGKPHAMPIWGLWLDGGFWFSTDPASRKARNLAARSQTVVHLESGDEVVILEGEAHMVAASEAPAAFVAEYRTKYGVEVDLSNPAFALFRVIPRRALAWFETDYPGSATAWEPLPQDDA